MNRVGDESIIPSSGNVFEDLGFPNPEERRLKARLASRIYDAIETREWTQAETAQSLGLNQADAARLMRGQLKDFPIVRLMDLLTALDYRVTIYWEGSNQPPEVIQVGRMR